jgi:hypothetical protein
MAAEQRMPPGTPKYFRVRHPHPALRSVSTIDASRRLRGFRRNQARSAASARSVLRYASTLDVEIAPGSAKNTSLLATRR